MSTGMAWASIAVMLFAGDVIAAEKRPNVVLIISDDQKWTDFGFMGHPTIRTPNLDRLASQGALFTHGYVTAPVCRPSLASIMTGQHGHRTGICGNDPPEGTDRVASQELIRRVPTVPRLLASAGYRCLQTGKFWEGSYENAGFTHGMTPAGERHGGAGLAIGRDTMKPIFDFIEQGGDTPFFVWYAPMMPHDPHNPPQRLLEKYQTPERHKKVAAYWAMCEWFDETCGELIGYLEKHGLIDNTLILFVTDNGWVQALDGERRARGWWAPRSKLSRYDGGLRTPIMASWGGRVSAARFDVPVSSIDLAPTILRACGLEVPAEMGGADLLAVAAGRQQIADRPVFGHVFQHTDIELGNPDRNVTHRWIRQGPWKLIVAQDDSKSAELYNIEQEPHETLNLADTQPEVLQRLRDRLDAWWTPQPALQAR